MLQEPIQKNSYHHEYQRDEKRNSAEEQDITMFSEMLREE